MSIISKDVRKLHRMFERSWNLYCLGHNGDRISRSIRQSVRAALKYSLTPEEETWIDRIESLRTEMNSSTRQIKRTDFGARNHDSNLKLDEMRTGVEVTDTLVEVLAARRPVDFVFIDGHHDEHATRHITNRFSPFLAKQRFLFSMILPGLKVWQER